MTFEWFVSLRYLRAKRKQTFISVISFISIAGVTLGVAALILVMSVMTGFHDGVRQQILGNVPHVLVQHYGGPILDYEKLAAKIRALPHVTDVSPYVSREAMLLSRGNVAAANVKGIEPEHKVLDQAFLTVDDKPVRGLLFQADANPPGQRHSAHVQHHPLRHDPEDEALSGGGHFRGTEQLSRQLHRLYLPAGGTGLLR